MRAHALTAAVVHGLAVFPLSQSKLPAIASAHPDGAPCTGECGNPGHGVYDATTNPEHIMTLFQAAPWAAGYGIACGRAPHFLFGLDLDRKDGIDGHANLAALAARLGFELPATATVITQSGGLHHWYTAPAGLRVPNTASVLAPGVDTRGHGGYLVGPGSMGLYGRYHFHPERGPRHIAAAPTALLRLLTAPQSRSQPHRGIRRPVGASGSPTRRLEGLERVVLDCGPRDLNNRLYWAARKAFAAGDIDPQQATRTLLAAAVRRGHPETPALRTIRSARKGAARDRQENGHG